MKRETTAALLILSVLVALRLPYVFHGFLNVDEAIFAACAKGMLSGRLLYRDIFEIKPPLTYLVYAGTARLFGPGNMTAVHVLGLAWSAATAWMLFLIGSLVRDRKAGYAAAVMYAVFGATAHPEDMIAVNTELLMVLPLAASSCLVLRAVREKRIVLFFASGALLGTALLFKIPAGVNLLAVAAFLAMTGMGRGRKTAVMQWGAFLGGTALPPVVCAFYFLFRGAFADMMFWSVIFGFRYCGQIPLFRSLHTLGVMMFYMVLRNQLFWILAGLSAGVFPGEDRPERIYLWLWGLVSIAAAGLGGRAFPHYYVQVIPPFAVLAGIASSALLDEGRGLRSAAVRRFLAACVVFGFLSPVVYSRYYALILNSYKGFRRTTEQQKSRHPLADYIRQNTAPGETIFVWGFYPELYVLSDRLCASRHITADWAVGKTPGAPLDRRVEIPGMMETLIEDIEKNAPALIVDTSPGGRFDYDRFPMNGYPALKHILETSYVLVSRLEGCDVYLRAQTDSTRALSMRALANARRGLYSEAISDFDRILQMNPGDAETYCNRGSAYLSLGDGARAISDFNRAIGINGNLQEAYYNRGMAYASLGQFDRAIQDYDRLLGKNPDNAAVRQSRAAAYYFSGRYASAREDMRWLRERGHRMNGDLLRMIESSPAR